jgi:serine/threonine-protein kinase
MIGRIFLGRYEAKRLLGEGGMGRVYLARQYDPDRYVVVKVMHEELRGDRRFMERFERETRTMARFQHPHSVALLDAALDDPLGPCIVMEYIKGVGLDRLLRKNKRFTAARVGRLVGQLCDVLQCAHELGIIHRDLKPANLMVVHADTPDEQIKVMDFGLAKIVDSVATLTPIDTSAEFAIGTPKYISPEQIRGDTVDPRGDLYSVGVIAYEMLSGRLPFERAAQMDLILAHATEAPPAFAELGLGSWVPLSVEQVVLSCLEKDPAARPQSARELGDRLSAALVEPDDVAAHEVASELPEPPVDPEALVFQFDAWMPQRIAIVKLRGFVYDHDGEVIQSQPALIRVRLGTRKHRPKKKPATISALLGLARDESAALVGQEVELRLQSQDSRQENRLHVTVVFHPPAGITSQDFKWRDRCTKLFCDVRAYLMGNTE